MTLSMELKSEGSVGLSVFQAGQIMGLCIANATIFSHADQLPLCSCFVRFFSLDIGYGTTIRSPETPAGACALRACG
jgi:hypothetical protein